MKCDGRVRPSKARCVEVAEDMIDRGISEEGVYRINRADAIKRRVSSNFTYNPLHRRAGGTQTKPGGIGSRPSFRSSI